MVAWMFRRSLSFIQLNQCSITHFNGLGVLQGQNDALIQKKRIKEGKLTSIRLTDFSNSASDLDIVGLQKMTLKLRSMMENSLSYGRIQTSIN